MKPLKEILAEEAERLEKIKGEDLFNVTYLIRGHTYDARTTAPELKSRNCGLSHGF